MSQQFCLKWNNHMNNMMDVFKNLLSTESMVDVTLACDGLSLKAHKMVLSACSPFFQSLFLENPCKHPIVILKDMRYTELKAIIEFMYHGEVNVAQDQLSALMKTAETLRVKGLAEVTNEKNAQSSTEPRTQDEPSHRSVPRSESPTMSSKRRRGRVRKRSLSDSNRSDDSNEPKIKQPVSPDIEELSGDMDASSSGQYSSMQSQVPMQSLPSHSTNSFHKSSVQQDPQIEEPPSADESEFGVEPAKLLEQTLTTDELSNRRSRQPMQSSMEMQRRPRSSTDHSSSLVPSSMPSEALSSNQQQPDSPPDIKPELLELDPPMSPVAGPSHSTDNSMMMYMDQSSMSSHPGTSFQDNSALVPQDSQPQDNPKASCKILKERSLNSTSVSKTTNSNVDVMQEVQQLKSLVVEVSGNQAKQNQNITQIGKKLELLFSKMDTPLKSSLATDLFMGDLSIPVSSDEGLIDLNERLSGNVELQSNLANHLKCSTRGSSISAFASAVFKRLMTKDVANQYSRLGKKGKKSLALFGAVHNTIAAALQLKFPKASIDDVYAKITRALATSSDWEGGRKEVTTEIVFNIKNECE